MLIDLLLLEGLLLIKNLVEKLLMLLPLAWLALVLILSFLVTLATEVGVGHFLLQLIDEWLNVLSSHPVKLITWVLILRLLLGLLDLLLVSSDLSSLKCDYVILLLLLLQLLSLLPESSLG